MAEKKSNDSIGKTLLVVLVLCLVCSIVVAGSAVGLKSRQQAQRALDKQRNILAVSGLMHPGMDADAVADTFAARITPRLVNLATGELLEKDPGKFNQAQALKDPQQSMALDASQDPAGIKRRSNLAEIYLVRDAQQKIGHRRQQQWQEIIERAPGEQGGNDRALRNIFPGEHGDKHRLQHADPSRNMDNHPGDTAHQQHP